MINGKINELYLTVDFCPTKLIGDNLGENTKK